MASNIRTRKHRTDNSDRFSLRDYLNSFSGPMMFFIVIISVIFVMSVFIRVSDIQVVGNVHYTDDEIIQAIDIEEGDNLFFFDRFAALSRVFAKLPYVREITVERSLPNKVIIKVEESQALAYIVLGEEKWTIDQDCKVLGKATEEELSGLIPIIGISPGTLMIGEPLTTSDGNTDIVNYIAEVLFQLEERGLYTQVGTLDFTDPKNVEFDYADKFTVKIGGSTKVEHKFGMLVSVLGQLLVGDVGIIDVSSASVAHFMPN